MKKIFILFTALIALAGCKKSNIEIFDENPEVRLGASIAELRTMLTSAQNGWVATLPTQAGGGFAFHMSFDANENVKMYGDLTNVSANTSATSTYRLKTVLGTELIFDTFNYISLLVDPVPTVFGGAASSGFKSDIEFLHKRSNKDSVFFTGKKYGQPLIMVKATAAQKLAYDAGEYKTAIDKIKNFIATTPYPYIEIVSGTTTLKVGMSLNVNSTLANGKRVSLSGVLADGKSTATGTAKFAFKLDGADILGDGLIYQGITFKKIVWKDATTLVIYDSTGKEYVIKNSSTPLTPLNLLFGFPTTFAYRKITIPSTGLPAGVTSGFNSVYSSMVSLFTASSRTVTSTVLTLTGNSTLTVDVNYATPSAFVATATYTYERVGDTFTLSAPSYSGNWTTRAAQLLPLTNYLQSGPFKVDWVTSTNPANTSLMGGFYRVADPTSFFYGAL